MDKETKQALEILAFFLLMCVFCIGMFFQSWNGVKDAERELQKYEQNLKTREEEQLEYRQQTTQNMKTEAVHTSQIDTIVPMAEDRQIPEYRYIAGCPLSRKVQRQIFDICAGANISFEFVMAIIEKESDFDPECISDGGESVGLMQIQSRWHREQMDRLR